MRCRVRADFHSLAGAVAQRQGKPGDAAEFYRGALRLKPAEGRNWIGLAMALEADGHAPEAREAYRRTCRPGIRRSGCRRWRSASCVSKTNAASLGAMQPLR